MIFSQEKKFVGKRSDYQTRIRGDLSKKKGDIKQGMSQGGRTTTLGEKTINSYNEYAKTITRAIRRWTQKKKTLNERIKTASRHAVNTKKKTCRPRRGGTGKRLCKGRIKDFEKGREKN